MSSDFVKYFEKEGKRTPFFNSKGLIKIKVLFNDLEDKIFDWIFDLIEGNLKTNINDLENVREMVSLNHIPVVKTIDDKMVLAKNVYSVNENDIIIDFKRIADFKKEKNISSVIESYKCPLFSQFQYNNDKLIKEIEINYDNKIKDFKQENIIFRLHQELDKEKCLKNQALSLTQSFIPNTLNGKLSPSPILENSPVIISSPKFLRPSKIN